MKGRDLGRGFAEVEEVWWVVGGEAEEMRSVL